MQAPSRIEREQTWIYAQRKTDGAAGGADEKKEQFLVLLLLNLFGFSQSVNRFYRLEKKNTNRSFMKLYMLI